jgi:hypothetical protein
MMASWESDPIVDAGEHAPAGGQQPAWASDPIVQSDNDGPNLGDRSSGIGAGRSLLRGINDGLTFGFADEISSGLSATLNPVTGSGNDGDTWRERYDSNVEGERALDRQAREDNPAASAVGGVAGGMLPMALTAGASMLPAAGRAATGPLSRAAAQTAPSLTQAAVEGSAIGAGYGGLYGLGTAEGDLLERAPAAVEGAVVGAAVGAGVPLALGAGRAAISAARSPDRSAVQQVERALERDGMTVEQFRRQSDELQQRYPGTAMPADAGGENVQGLIERVAQTPGAGRSQVIPALTERQQGQPQRITDTLQDLTKSERDSFNRAAEDLGRATGSKRTAFQAVEEAMAQRSRDAQPLYAKAYQEPVPWSTELEDLFKRPVMQEAYRAASRRAGNEGRDFYGKFIDLKDDGTFTMQSVPSTGDLDFIKKTLDSKMGTLERAGDYSESRVIKGIRTKLVDMMDAASPTYRQARSAWAGPSQFIEQVDNGRSILSRNISAEELAANLGKLSPSELDGYRIGAVSAIVNRMGSDPAKMADVTKYLRSKEMRDKVAAMLPDDAARQHWGEMLDFEVNASSMAGRSLGNSATARRAAEMADADGIGGDLVLGALAGTPVGGLFSQFINKAGRGLRDGLRAHSDQAVADALTQPGGLAAVQAKATRAGQPVPPPLMITRGAGAGAVQNNAERSARPTINSLLPSVREQLAAGQEPDIDTLAKETGATRLAVGRAIHLAKKEQRALAQNYKNPLMAKNAIRKAGLKPDNFQITRGHSGNWAINLK